MVLSMLLTGMILLMLIVDIALPIIWLIVLLDFLFLNTFILLLLDGSPSIICSRRCIPKIESIKRSPVLVAIEVCVGQILYSSCDLGRCKTVVSLNLTIGLELTDHTLASFLLYLFISRLEILLLGLLFDYFYEILIANIAEKRFLV